MEKIYYGLVFLTMITLNSCEKLFIDDAPGNISGMGSNSGKLQIKETFILPKGIKLNDTITEINIIDKSLPRFGSGSVHLKISLLNYSDVAKTVYFPKGLILRCNSPENHNLLLLQTCWISMNPNGSKTIVLDAYSTNLAREDPDATGLTYEIMGISDSKVINDLLDLISWRKINYEMIVGSDSDENTDSYLDMIYPMRELVWKLTDHGSGITDEDKKFIMNIPELSASEIPPKDNLGKFPVYFDEVVVVKSN
jgi:hypothetical protein